MAEIKSKKKNLINPILSIHIDKDWSAMEFQITFNSLNNIYEFNSLILQYKSKVQYNKYLLSKILGDKVSPSKLNANMRKKYTAKSDQIQNLYLEFIQKSFASLELHYILTHRAVRRILDLTFDQEKQLSFRESLKKSKVISPINAIELRVKSTLPPILPLQVKRIKFGSEGYIDLLGLGKIFEVIRDFLFYYIPNKKDKIINEIKEKEIEEKNQQIMKLKIDNLKSIGLSDQEIKDVIDKEAFHINEIKVLMEKGNITKIEIKS